MVKWTTLVIVALLLAAGSLYVLHYYWIVLGERGLQADANHTAGWTAPGELAAIAASFFGLVAGVVLSMVATTGLVGRLRSCRRPSR